MTCSRFLGGKEAGIQPCKGRRGAREGQCTKGRPHALPGPSSSVFLHAWNMFRLMGYRDVDLGFGAHACSREQASKPARGEKGRRRSRAGPIPSLAPKQLMLGHRMIILVVVLVVVTVV